MDQIHFKINKMKKSEDFDLKCPKDFDEDFRLNMQKYLRWAFEKFPRPPKYHASLS